MSRLFIHFPISSTPREYPFSCIRTGRTPMDALIEDFLNLIRSVPIIPLIIVFSLLRRFISKKPAASTDTGQPQYPSTTVTEPDSTWGSPYAPAFDDPRGNQRTPDPSIDPVPSSPVFG